MAIASSAAMLAVAAGFGCQSMSDEGNSRVWFAGLSSPVSLYRTHKKLQSSLVVGDVSLVHHHQLRAAQPWSSGQSTPALNKAAVAEIVTKERVTGIEFPNTLKTPGGAAQLSLVGVGVREKQIALFKVKVYAVGFYIDASSLADSSLRAWKGKAEGELAKDEAFFKTLINIPVEKALQIVLVRDVEGSQFWGALDESLIPRLKAAGAGTPGEEAVAAVGGVFKDRALKQGTKVFLTWCQPSLLQIAVCVAKESSNSAAPAASIDSAPLLSCLFDIYLGQDPVSLSAKASIASGIPSLL